MITTELVDGKALVGARVLHQWPIEGWVTGRVRGVCRRGGFSHVVGYAASYPLGAAVVDSILDSASHGQDDRWHLLVPAGRPGGLGVRGGRVDLGCARVVRCSFPLVGRL